MKTSPWVYLVIVNWNEKKLLKECLKSIKNHTDYPNFRVIVVDNGSSDGSAEMIRRDFPWAEFIENRVNVGFAKANNQGIKSALKQGADYVFLLNNDTRMVHSDWITRMVEVAEANPDIGIVGCKLIYPDGRIQHVGCVINVREVVFHPGKGKRDDGAYDKIRNVDYVMGAAFMIKRHVVQKIGLFDEGFSPALFEEIDYCVRARMVGYMTIYNPRTTVIHYASITIKRHFSKLQREFLWHKNKLRFMLLNFPLKWLLERTKYELKIVISFIFEKKDITRRLSPLNVKLRRGRHRRLRIYLKALSENIKVLNDIIQKRMYRTSKIWY